MWERGLDINENRKIGTRGRNLKEGNLEMSLLTDLSAYINALSGLRHRRMFLKTVMVKQSRYRTGVAQRV